MTPKFMPRKHLHPIINQFWENYFLMGFERLNHSADPRWIAIDLEQFVEVCEEVGRQTATADEIRKVFRRNKFHNHYELKNFLSRIHHWPMRFYAFRAVDMEREYLSGCSDVVQE